MSGVVVVLDPVVGRRTSGDVQHADLQLVQGLVGQPQVSNQVPNALVAAWKRRR